MSKQIFAIFNDEDVLLKSIKPLRGKGINIKNVFTPCPVHGLDQELEIGRTWISVCSFIYGCIGGSLAILMTWYMMVHDWPMDIGGKPNFSYYKNLPAFIPVIFESTVLCAAHGMVITFYLRSKTLPGITAFVPDKRMTDDRFVMQVEIADVSAEAQATEILKQHGAEEVKEYGK
jgi:hypothetical protein